jgi:hypothetical protein
MSHIEAAARKAQMGPHGRRRNQGAAVPTIVARCPSPPLCPTRQLSLERTQAGPAPPPLASGSASTPYPTSAPHDRSLRHRSASLLRHVQHPRPPVRGMTTFLLAIELDPRGTRAPPPRSQASPGFVRRQPRRDTRGESGAEGRLRVRVFDPRSSRGGDAMSERGNLERPEICLWIVRVCYDAMIFFR